MASIKNKKKLCAWIILLFVCLLIIQVAGHLVVSTDKKIAVVNIDGRILKAEIAESPRELYRGLSGRRYLCPDCAMLFNFKESAEQLFVMRDMKFPLDIIFINNGRIISLAQNLSPDKNKLDRYYSSQGNCNQVLEVNAGFAAENNIRTGDLVGFEIVNK